MGVTTGTLKIGMGELIDFLRTNISKVIKYCAVSLIVVPLGQLMLWLLLKPGGMSAVPANVGAFAIMTVPNYLLNRYWVWQKQGKNSVSREILPFWVLAFCGLVASTGLVWLVRDRSTIVIMGANIVGYGIVWVAKFFILEKLLFGPSTEDKDAVPESVGSGVSSL